MTATNPTETIQECWHRVGGHLLRSDGTLPKMRFNLQANPELAHTLEKVALSYLPRCEEKFKLLQRRQDIDNLIMGDTDFDADKVLADGKHVDAKIKEFDAKLVRINAAAMATIIKSKGFAQAKAEMPEGTDDTKVAYHLLSPIIQHAVAAACEHSGYLADHRDDPRILDIVKSIVPRQMGGKSV